MQPALLVPKPSAPPGVDVQFALCDVSTREGVGRAYTYAQLSANDQGEVVPPKEILLWRNGTIKTTKGNFLFDDKARDIIWGDWQERMGGVPSPSGDGPGSFDYDHDEWNPNLPGYLKLSAGNFDLGRDGKDFWLVGCWYTDLCDERIRKKEKRSTSPAFDFDPKSGRLLRLYNVAITNVPATHKQPLLASMGVKGELYLPPSDAALVEPAKTLVQVPIALSLPGDLSDADRQQLGILFTAAARGALEQMMASAAPPPAGASALAPTSAPVPPRPRAAAGVVPFAEYPLDSSETWDEAAALERVKTWATKSGELDLALYGSAFGYIAAEGAELADYRLLHHDVKDDGLVTVWGGVLACCDAVQSDEIKIPEQDLAEVKEHLAKHCREFDKRAPWDEESENASARTQTPTPAPAASPRATTRSDGMQEGTWYDYYSQEELSMICIGEQIESVFILTALARKAPEGKRDLFSAMCRAAVKNMTELASYAADIGLPTVNEAAGEVASVTAEELAGIDDPEVKTALTSLSKFKVQRSLTTLSSVMAQLNVEGPSGLRPAILDLQALAQEAQAEAERATQLAATTSIDVQRRAKLAELQAANIMSASQAQEALGLDPVTGKPKMVKLSGGTVEARPWTLGEIAEYEDRARKRLGGRKPETTSVTVPGMTTSAPPPPATSAPPPPALAPPGNPGAAEPTKEEVELVREGVLASGGECTYEHALEMCRANRAGKFGPATITSSSK